MIRWPLTVKQPSRSHNYIPTLDGWRAIAILVVMFSHASDSIERLSRSLEINDLVSLKFGFFGVQIFFALSGFLITTHLVNSDRVDGSVNLRKFYLRRCFRILPPAVLYLLGVAALAYLSVIDLSPARWFAALLFFNNYSTAQDSWYVDHFWSLAVEEHFYFVWPFIFLLARKNTTRLWIALSIALAIAIWRALSFKFFNGFATPHIWSRTDISADSIMWGAVFALIQAEHSWKRRFDVICEHRWFFKILSPIIVVLGFKFLAFPGWWVGELMIHSALVMLLPLAIFAGVTRSSGRFFKFMENPLVRWIGRISFSLYLYQQVFLVVDDSLAPALSPLQNFPINFLMAFVLAIVSYEFVEKPFIVWGRMIERRLHAGSA